MKRGIQVDIGLPDLSGVVVELRGKADALEARARDYREAISTIEKLTGAAPKSPPPVARRPRVKAETAAAPVKKRFAPQSPASGSMPSKAAKPGTEVCGQCGRSKLFKAMGRGTKGLLKFHYAEKCGLPCCGGSLGPATAEDLKGGKHSKNVCPKCDARVQFK